MRKRVLSLGIVLAFVGLAAGIGHAAMSGSFHGDPQRLRKYMAFRINDMLDQVNATPDQRQRALAVANPVLDQAVRVVQQHRQAHAQMLQEWQKDNPDPNVFHTLVDQQANAMRDLGTSVSNAFLQLHGILTPQQRAQLAQEFQQKMQCH